MTQLGIDVSEHNGEIDWKEIAEAGVRFAIIRAGYGSAYLDSRFYENVNGAHDAGLKLGVYHFGYARHGGELEVERDFLLSILEDCGLTPDLLPMGVFWDVEEDSYRNREFPRPGVINRMCHAFCEGVAAKGYRAGIYSSAGWLTSHIRASEFGSHTIWAAQWWKECMVKEAVIWQFTDHLEIAGRLFDGNYLLEKDYGDER